MSDAGTKLIQIAAKLWRCVERVEDATTLKQARRLAGVAVDSLKGDALRIRMATDELRVAYDALAKRLEEAEQTLRFVERMVNHHAANPAFTPQEILGAIQHHPAITDITLGYANGVVPDTRDPWAENEALRKDLGEAYGHLWHINEAGNPGRYYPPEEAAYAARKLLLGHLDDEQKRNGINNARQAIDAAIAAEGKR